MQVKKLFAKVWRAVTARAAYLGAVLLPRLGFSTSGASLRDIARRRGYDRSIRQRILEIEALVAGERPPEDRLPEYQQRCAQAEEDLRREIEAGRPVHNVLRLHAVLAEKLKDYDEATRRWERVLVEEAEEPRVNTVVHVLLGYRRQGRTDDATTLLDRFPDSVRSAPRVQKVERSILRHLQVQEGATEIRSLVVHADEVGPTLTQLDAALSKQGFADALRTPLGEVLRACARLQRQRELDLRSQQDDPGFREELAQRSPSCPPKVIVTSGFGWSGSGAVSDLLRDRIAPFEPYPPPELLMFRTKWGNTPVHRVISDARANSFRPSAAVDALLTSVLGLAPRDLDGMRFELARRKSALGHLVDDEANAVRLIEACGILLRDLEEATSRGCASQRTVLAILADFVQRSLCLERLAAGGSVLVDNAMHPSALRALDILPSATAIVVTRDPRDQFVNLRSARRSDNGGDEAGYASFVKAQRGMLDGFLGVLQRDGRTSDIRCVRFEDVVLDESTREAMLRTLGVDPVDDDGDQQRRFRPEESANNVGLHFAEPDAAALDEIYEELRPLLDEVHASPGVQLDGSFRPSSGR